MRNFLYFFILISFLGCGNLWAQHFSTVEPPLITDIKADGDQITLYWDGYPPESKVCYNLYFTQRSGQDYVKINMNPIKDKFFIVRGLEKNIYYYFVATSVSNDVQPVESKYSNEEEWEMDSSSKNTVAVHDVRRNGYVDIGEKSGMAKFRDPLRSGLKGYNIYMSESSDGKFEKINAVPLGNPRTFMVRRLILKHRYYFAFTAVGMDGKESDRSQVVSYVAQPLTNDIIPKLSTANHLPQAQPAPTKTQP